MRTGNKTKRSDAELEMTPMIDVVFLLLIFFMCTMKFKMDEGLIKANLPLKDGPTIGPPIDYENIVLYIEPAFRNVEGYEITERCKGEKDIVMQLENTRVLTFDALEGQLRSIRRLAAGGADGVSLEIAANQFLPFAMVAEAVERCGKVGIKRLKFRMPGIRARARFPVTW